jgi:hypothetical protein
LPYRLLDSRLTVIALCCCAMFELYQTIELLVNRSVRQLLTSPLSNNHIKTYNSVVCQPKSANGFLFNSLRAIIKKFSTIAHNWKRARAFYYALHTMQTSVDNSPVCMLEWQRVKHTSVRGGRERQDTVRRDRSQTW